MIIKIIMSMVTHPLIPNLVVATQDGVFNLKSANITHTYHVYQSQKGRGEITNTYYLLLADVRYAFFLPKIHLCSSKWGGIGQYSRLLVQIIHNLVPIYK